MAENKAYIVCKFVGEESADGDELVQIGHSDWLSSTNKERCVAKLIKSQKPVQLKWPSNYDPEAKEAWSRRKDVTWKENAVAVLHHETDDWPDAAAARERVILHGKAVISKKERKEYAKRLAPNDELNKKTEPLRKKRNIGNKSIKPQSVEEKLKSASNLGSGYSSDDSDDNIPLGNVITKRRSSKSAGNKLDDHPISSDDSLINEDSGKMTGPQKSEKIYMQSEEIKRLRKENGVLKKTIQETKQIRAENDVLKAAKSLVKDFPKLVDQVKELTAICRQAEARLKPMTVSSEVDLFVASSPAKVSKESSETSFNGHINETHFDTKPAVSPTSSDLTATGSKTKGPDVDAKTIVPSTPKTSTPSRSNMQIADNHVDDCVDSKVGSDTEESSADFVWFGDRKISRTRLGQIKHGKDTLLATSITGAIFSDKELALCNLTGKGNNKHKTELKKQKVNPQTVEDIIQYVIKVKNLDSEDKEAMEATHLKLYKSIGNVFSNFCKNDTAKNIIAAEHERLKAAASAVTPQVDVEAATPLDASTATNNS